MRKMLCVLVCMAPLLTVTRGQSQSGPIASPASPAPPADAAGTQPAGPPLTREDAERLALANNPRVSISHLLSLAQHQAVREARSAELPQLSGSITAQDANEASRVASGSLSASPRWRRGQLLAAHYRLRSHDQPGCLIAAARSSARGKRARHAGRCGPADRPAVLWSVTGTSASSCSGEDSNSASDHAGPGE